ncbi:MAG: secretin N-terminal domain-containing protein, partial [Phycisphaerae bacterium]
PSGASLILSGDRTDISRAEALIAQLDVEQSDGAKDYVVKLKNAEPTALSQILQQKFASGGGSSFGYHTRHFGAGSGSGLPRFIPDDVSKNLLVIATERQWPDIDNLIKQFDVESEVAPRSEVYKLTYASADDVVRMLQQAVIGRGGRRSMTGGQPQFSADARTNSIFAVATDEYHKIAREMIAKIDQPGYDELKEIPLEKADAEFVADQLRELLGVAESGRYGMRGGEPQVRILAEPMSNRVLVAATPEKFEQAKKYAAEIDANYAKAGYEERIFTLKHAEAREVVSVLESLYGSGEARPRYYYGPGGGNKTGGIKIMEAQGAVIVRAPKARLDRIAELIQTLEGNAGGANEIRSWHLPGADVRAIAQTIETMFQGRRRFSGGTGVDCTADEASSMLFVSAPADQMAKIAEHIETIKTNSPKETVFAVKYFPVVNARAEDIAAAIEPVIEAKWQADASRRTGRSRWDSYANRPQVSGDPNTKRVMVAGPEDLMPLVEQLVREMDVAPEGGAQVVRFVQLKKGKAEDLAPLVEDAVRKSGGSGYRPRRSYWRMMYGGYSPGGGSSESGEVTVTAIPSSNSLLLRGPEQKVEEAVKLALQIDGEARPDGPMIKTYVLKYADVFDVQDTIEGLLGGTSVGGFSDYGGDYGGSMFTSGRGSSRSRRRGGGQIVVT